MFRVYGLVETSKLAKRRNPLGITRLVSVHSRKRSIEVDLTTMAFLLLQFLRFLGSDVDLYIYTGQQLLNERENKMMRANFS